MTGNSHKINFSAGPAALPAEVLQEAAQAITNYNDSGLSILEIQHRGKYFDAILEESKTLVRELCGLDSNYEVLWLQGGGRMQFCMVPMNFLGENDTAGYIDSGSWAAEAIAYAKYYGNISVLASSKEDNYRHLPQWPTAIDPALSYLHFTTNNTIYGTQWPSIPKTAVPLIADMSSDIFSRQINYTNCAMFYAVAQKNIGPAGVTLVVIHKQLLQQIKRKLPPMLDFMEHVKKNSVLNTAPVFAIYVSLLMLRWTKQKGIAAIEAENTKKAELLYNEIERNTIFNMAIEPASRSKMNVCFGVNQPEWENLFVNHCKTNNITGIEGHRSVGSFRVSLYNAIPLSAVETLVETMKEFENTYAS